jgi:deoxyribodipyrimidine photo-lyase
LGKPRQFVDFEPRIHWSEIQTQSGTTGIDTLRIDSPAKQQPDLFEPMSEQCAE